MPFMKTPAESAKRPILAFGASPGRVGSLGKGLHAAQHAGLLALDVDLRDAWFAPNPTTQLLDAARHITRIRSIWLPSDLTGMLTEKRLVSMRDFLAQTKQDFGLRHLILPRAQDAQPERTVIRNLAREICRQRTGTPVRLAIGLRASDFRHDRWHLDQLAAIRRMAEEWELDLALDLTGNVSLAWEAEAAIMRVFPRLVNVRLGQWRQEDGSLLSTQSGQIANRTISMLIDQGYTGTLSFTTTARRQSACSAIAAHQMQDVLQRYTPDTRPSVAPENTSINDIHRLL
jgi:hypothetical protein